MQSKTIILIRHAKVLIDEDKVIDTKQLQEWILQYNLAPIEHSYRPQKLIDILEDVDCILTSTLGRTTLSAELLGKSSYITKSQFNELDIPEYNIDFLKLKPKNWLLLFRVMHLLKIRSKNSFITVARERAKEAVDTIEEILQTKNSLALFGHGGLNYFIAKELSKRGYILSSSFKENQNLGYRLFQKSID